MENLSCGKRFFFSFVDSDAFEEGTGRCSRLPPSLNTMTESRACSNNCIDTHIRTKFYLFFWMCANSPKSSIMRSAKHETYNCVAATPPGSSKDEMMREIMMHLHISATFVIRVVDNTGYMYITFPFEPPTGNYRYHQPRMRTNPALS
jgi:hypothetical protein